MRCRGARCSEASWVAKLRSLSSGHLAEFAGAKATGDPGREPNVTWIAPSNRQPFVIDAVRSALLSGSPKESKSSELRHFPNLGDSFRKGPATTASLMPPDPF